MRPAAAGELELAPTGPTSEAVASRKRARARRQRRAAARKALCVFMSVVLVVGLMPGLTAWGESDQVTTAAADETLDVNDDDTGSESSQTQGNPVVTNEEDELDENGDELIDDPDNEPGESDAVLDEETADAGEDAKVETPDESLALGDDVEAQNILLTQSEMAAQNDNGYYIDYGCSSANNWYLRYNCVGAIMLDKIDINMHRATSGSLTIKERYDGGRTSVDHKEESIPKNGDRYYSYTVTSGYKVVGVHNTGATLTIELQSLSAITLTLNGNGAKSSYTVTGYVGAPTKINKSPSRAGYKFTGWNTAPDGSGTHYDNNSSAVFNQSTTLYAEWTRTVDLRVYGSDATFTPASPITFYYDSTGAARPSSATVQLSGQNGWTAYGWGTGLTSNAKSVDASFTLRASSLAKTSTTYYALLQRDLKVKYDANGADEGKDTVPDDTTDAQVINTHSYKAASSKTTVTLADPGDNLKKNHYDFVGWTIDGVLYDMKENKTYTWANAKTNAEVTAYATWEYNPLEPNTVTVQMEGWTYGDDPKSPEVHADYGTPKVEYSDSRSGTNWTETVPTDAGTYWVRATVDENKSANYQGGTASTSFTIAPKSVGIEWINDGFAYDGAKHAPTAKVKEADLVGRDTCDVTVSGEQTDAGSYTAWASKLSNANYALPASGTSHAFTINKVPLTVKAKDNAITYGDAPQANGVEYFDKDGKKLSSEPAGLTGSLSYSYDYKQYDDVGTGKYTIQPSGLGSDNYIITYELGELTVNPREVTLLWSTPDSFIYNGEDQTWPAPAVGNTVNGDKLTAKWADGADKNVYKATNIDTYTPTVKSLSGDKAGNYKLPDNATGSWNITMTPAPTTNNMTVSIAGWTYGKYNKDKNGPTVSADYGADTATFAYYTDEACEHPVAAANMDTTNKVPKNVGSYWVKATIAEPANKSYPAGSAICKFEITKAAITVRADDVVCTMDNADSVALTYSIVGELVDSDRSLINSAIQLTRPNPSTPETWKIGIGWKGSTAPPDNYAVKFEDGFLIVKGSNVPTGGTSTTRDNTYIYNGSARTADITVHGSGAGNYPLTTYYSDKNISQAANIGGDVTNNDVLLLKVGTQYSGADMPGSFERVWEALRGNASVNPEYKDTGTYTTYFVGIGAASSTYTFVWGNAVVTIVPAPLVVNVGDKTIEYGDDPATKPFDNPDKEVTYAGFVADETESGLRASEELEGSVKAYSYGGDTASRVPGRYPISVATTDLSATNYSITYAPGTLIVKPKTLTIKWPENDKRTYTGSEQTYAPELEGVPAGAKVSLKLTAASTTEATNVGSYPISVVGLEGDDAANFTLDVSDSSVLSHSWSILPASLTVKAENNEITYGDAPAGNGVKYFDSEGKEISTISVPGTLQYAFDYKQYDDVGTGSYTITPSGLASSNYNITYVPGTLTVKPRVVSLTWPAPSALRWTGRPITYGQPILGNVVNNDAVSIGSYTGNTETDGGSYTATVVSLAGGKAANYALPSNATGAWSIYGAVNNVKVSIDDWTYGDTPSTPKVVRADYGDTLATFGYSKSPYGPFTSALPTNATTGLVDAGTYWLQTKIAGSAVYDPAEVITKFEVLPREVTLTWSPTSFTYDGQKHAPTAAVSGTLGNETCAVLAVSGETKAVGAHTATAVALDNPNYKLPINDSVQFTIATRVLTVTANPAAITYGDAPTDAGVTYSGFASGEGAANLSGTLAYSFNYKQYDDVGGGSYTITPGGLSSPNYAITYVPGALTVKPRVVTLTWDAPSTFTYDGGTHAWGVPTVGNTVNGDTLAATWAQGAVASATDTGTYTPAVGGLTAGANTNTNADNYALPSPAAGTWSIVPAANTMSVSIAGWTYGKYTAACGPTVTAAFGANPGNITYTYYTDANCTNQVATADMDTTYNVPKNAGSYWVKATIPAGPNNNYPAAEATCAFTISKADITVTADDQVAVWNDAGAVETLTCSVSGDVASWEGPAATFASTYFAGASKARPDNIDPAKTGAYDIVAGWADGKSADDLPNYNVEFVDGTYTVTRLLANVTANGASWVYDGETEKGITVSVSAATEEKALDGTSNPSVDVYYTANEDGFKNIVDDATMKTLQTATTIDDDFKAKFSTLKTNLAAAENVQKNSSPTYKDAGTHRVYFIVVSDQAKPDVVLGYKDVVVTPAPLVVTANDKGIAYGEDAANDGVKYAGLVAADLDGSDPKSGVLDVSGLTYGYGSYAKGSAPGKYPITPSGLKAANYSITYQPGTLTVGVKELELEWPVGEGKDSFPYTGGERAYRPTLVGAPAGAKVQVQMTAGTDTATDAGSYTATVSGLTGDDAAYYTLKPGTKYSHPWSITPVALTVTANDNSIVYGDAPAANGVTYAGLLTPEAQAGFTGSLSYSYDYAQFGPVGKYAITPSGIASPNYTIEFKPGKLTVLKKALSLEWSDDDELEYTGEPWTYDKPLLDGVVDGDIVRVGLYQGATETDVGLYTASVVSLTGRDKDNYVLTLPASHPWMILGVENGLDLSMDGWTYGDEPRAPELTADHDGDNATFAYYLDEACEKPVPAEDLAGGVPAVAGSYWVKATVPKSDAGNYREAEAVAGFKVERRPITVRAADQIVKVGDAVATDAGQVTADDLASGDKLSGITISASSPTTLPSFGGSVTPSAATIQNAAGRDVTSSYDITYERGDLNVVGDYSTENEKVIYVVLADIWVTVAEAAELLADPGLDDVLMVRTGAAAYETATGDPLEVTVADRGGLAAAVGVYTVTFKTNPEVSARVHVMSSSSTDDETGVTVYANDTEPSADLLRRAKAGDADAVAALIALAGAVAVDEDGNTIPVTGVDLSAVDPDKPGTYRAAYSTEDGDSAAANVVLTEGADDPDPKDELREKIEEAEDIVGPLDPANPTDEEKKLLEEIDAAKLILDDPDATPEQIRDAIKRLDDAIAALKAAREGAGNDNGGSAGNGSSGGNGSATKPDSTRKAAAAKTGDALPVALLTTTALAAACALAFAYRRRESRD